MMDYWPQFTDFVSRELAAGGPDPQLRLINYLATTLNSDPVEHVWAAGCYASHHCVPSAFAIWKDFRPEETFRNGKLRNFLQDNWNYLPVRPEMRSHRMLEKREKCLVDFAVYACDGRWQKGSFDEIWTDSIRSVAYYNRYMAIKFLEMLRQTVRPDLEMPDLRAKGAWSPRRTLALLFPEQSVLADKGNETSEAIETVNSAAKEAQKELAKSQIFINLFQLQVLLCEFREYLNGGYAPGASHYEEILYMDKAAQRFDMSPIYQARQNLFPHEHLGELNGWNKDLKKLMPKLVEKSV